MFSDLSVAFLCASWLTLTQFTYPISTNTFSNIINDQKFPKTEEESKEITGPDLRTVLLGT